MGLIADIHADRWMSSSMFVPAWGSMRTRRPILIAFRYVCLCVYPLGDPGSTVSHLTEGHPQKSKDLIRRPRDHGVHGPQDPPTSSASSFHDVQKLRNIRGFRSAGAERGGGIQSQTLHVWYNAYIDARSTTPVWDSYATWSVLE